MQHAAAVTTATTTGTIF